MADYSSEVMQPRRQRNNIYLRYLRYFKVLRYLDKEVWAAQMVSLGSDLWACELERHFRLTAVSMEPA